MGSRNFCECVIKHIRQPILMLLFYTVQLLKDMFRIYIGFNHEIYWLLGKVIFETEGRENKFELIPMPQAEVLILRLITKPSG